jgi:hypothetical protein
VPEWCELERGTLAAMSAAWSIPKRAAFRFGFIYLALYELPWAIKRPLLPDWRRAAESVGAFEGVVRWFGHHWASWTRCRRSTQEAAIRSSSTRDTSAAS